MKQKLISVAPNKCVFDYWIYKYNNKTLIYIIMVTHIVLSLELQFLLQRGDITNLLNSSVGVYIFTEMLHAKM